MIGLGIEKINTRAGTQFCQIVALQISELIWDFSLLPNEQAAGWKDVYMSGYRYVGLFDTQCCQTNWGFIYFLNWVEFS